MTEPMVALHFIECPCELCEAARKTSNLQCQSAGRTEKGGLMAYFSNSSEGDVLDAMCAKCVHQGPVDGPGCNVLLLQLLWNYEQDLAGKGDPAAKIKKETLDILITQEAPADKPNFPVTKCTMFFPVEWLSDRGKFEIGKADQAEADRIKLHEWNKIYGKVANV